MRANIELLFAFAKLLQKKINDFYRRIPNALILKQKQEASGFQEHFYVKKKRKLTNQTIQIFDLIMNQ